MFCRYGMLEAELGGVQRQAGGFARVGDRCAARSSIIDLLAAYGVSRFRQMNADLVRSSRLELAKQNRMSRQPLNNVEMRNGVFAAAFWAAAAPAVATIANQPSRERLRLEKAGDDSHVTPYDGVSVKLLAKGPLRRDGAGEND